MKSDFIKSLKIKCKCNNYMDLFFKSKYGFKVISFYCRNCDTEDNFFIKYISILGNDRDKILINLFKHECMNTFYGFVYHKTLTVIDKSDILINDWEDFKKILLLQDRQKIEEKYNQYILFI